jgi:hypothetical protein
MDNALRDSMSLIDVSGYLIIVTIVVFLLLGVAATVFLHTRYEAMARELAREVSDSRSFSFPVLTQIINEALTAARQHGGEINTQAIIEHRFQTELKGLLIIERFLKSATGLMIILGLVGTFYGLTLSIGKLVALVSGDVTAAAELTTSLTRGLTDALSGMSVAFSTSLFGISAAIIMTLLGVFTNVADRRNALMVQLEAYLDNVLLGSFRNAGADRALGLGTAGSPSGEGLERMVAGFGQSVARLEGAVEHFEAALNTFSGSTREFQEFNLHLKDNIQRMSLNFADLSSTLERSTSALRRDG